MESNHAGARNDPDLDPFAEYDDPGECGVGLDRKVILIWSRARRRISW